LAILACFLAYAGATAPTSVDIAEEVIVREYSLGTPQREIAALLGVSVATVGRIAARWRRGEPLTSGRGPGREQFVECYVSRQFSTFLPTAREMLFLGRV
jgi:transposase